VSDHDIEQCSSLLSDEVKQTEGKRVLVHCHQVTFDVDVKDMYLYPFLATLIFEYILPHIHTYRACHVQQQWSSRIS